MNRLKTAFLKNWDLKTQKNIYSNRRQWSVFLITRYFKKQTYDFVKRLIAFLKITFFKSYIFKSHFMKLQT